MHPDASVTQWINRLKAGDPDAAQKLWERYFRRLVGLARKKLRSAPRRAADEEDVALSAFDSFCRNAEAGHASNAFLLESALSLRDRDTWFGRFEATGKTGHDLGLPLEDSFTVAKLQGGYTRSFAARRGMVAGIGGALSASIVPQSLVATYGGRVNPGVAFFVTVRPARVMM